MRYLALFVLALCLIAPMTAQARSSFAQAANDLCGDLIYTRPASLMAEANEARANALFLAVKGKAPSDTDPARDIAAIESELQELERVRSGLQGLQPPPRMRRPGLTCCS